MKRRWIRRALALGMILAGALSLTPEAGAQGGQDVEEALRRTDELLQQAAEVVRSADSQRARILLDQAYAIQRNAWTQFQNGHPRLATRLTIEARDLAKRAVRLAREDSSLRTRARRELEKAWDMLQRAREQLGDVSDHAGRLLQEAHQQIERGRSQFQEQNYEAALRLAISAQSRLRPVPAGPLISTAVA